MATLRERIERTRDRMDCAHEEMLASRDIRDQAGKAAADAEYEYRRRRLICNRLVDALEELRGEYRAYAAH